MGFTSASQTITRFTAPVPPRLDREAVSRAVARRAFREIDADLATGTASWGWVPAHDPLADAFGPADLFLERWLVVGFRYDRRAVPGKLLWVERRRAEDARRAELGQDRLGAALRREIKAEIADRLLLRALPMPRFFECAWNLDIGVAYFTGKARAPREAFADLFRETFGVGPVPMIPWVVAERVGLPARIVEAVHAAEPTSLGAEPPGPRATAPGVPHLPLAPGGGVEAATDVADDDAEEVPF